MGVDSLLVLVHSLVHELVVPWHLVHVGELRELSHRVHGAHLELVHILEAWSVHHFSIISEVGTDVERIAQVRDPASCGVLPLYLAATRSTASYPVVLN